VSPVATPPVVVVTGATAGVGRAIVRAYADRGAAIALLARGQEALEATEREVTARGGRSLAIPTDVADAAAVEEAATRAERELGPIRVWVNNAMTSVFSPIAELEAEEIARVTAVTYLGVVHGTLAALRRMRPRDKGTIVQVGSALAFRGIPLQAAYCAAKHAAKGFTDSLRAELLHDRSNIRVTEVHLPAVNTPQFDWVRSRLPNKAQPVPPIYQPELAARTILWAADRGRERVHLGPSTVATVWGSRFFPSLVDRYLARTGYGSQQTDEPEPSGRPDNLRSPVEGDRGAHGRFDGRAHETSLQAWITRNRGWIAAAAIAGAMVSLGRRGDR